MINQNEIPALLAHKLPEIKNELKHRGNVYRSIEVLADYTRRMAITHDFAKAEKCMMLADKLYSRGNNQVRTAVENVFVFSFSSIMSSCNIVEWRMLQSFMPARLYTLYMQQVLKS